MHDLLWIHGFPLSSRVFDRQLSIAATHVMPDLPGFGGAPPPRGEMTMEAYAREVLPEREVIVAGLSMGGYIALAMARLAPERVKGLILIDTRETADTDEQRKARYDSIEKVKREGIAPVVASMLPKMVTKNAPPELVDEVRGIMESSSPAGVIAALDAMAKRPASDLGALNIPVLVVVGEEDAITPPSDAERMAAALPDARLVKIAGAAHLSNVEQAHDFNAAVQGWLQNQR